MLVLRSKTIFFLGKVGFPYKNFFSWDYCLFSPTPIFSKGRPKTQSFRPLAVLCPKKCFLLFLDFPGESCVWLEEHTVTVECLLASNLIKLSGTFY